ncbi:MAG: M23 family metallopeptidase, partial [Betaproteobacteria bacterium]|nr:M23 family metallopeptidase [Betaproteobacteria bacterium]
FGLRTDPFTGSLAMHEGIDFSAEVGTRVLATAPGVVIRSEWDNGYGQVIEIQHAENYVTRYAHLSKRRVAENTLVQRGTLIGDVGKKVICSKNLNLNRSPSVKKGLTR